MIGHVASLPQLVENCMCTTTMSAYRLHEMIKISAFVPIEKNTANLLFFSKWGCIDAVNIYFFYTYNFQDNN